MKQNDIDFVIFWVDGSDPAWQAERSRYTSGSEFVDASPIRSRDWRNLRYWFRAAERFAPWVRRIHFVTWGHRPAWLETENPKLHVVEHSDFIPAEFLPTFNSLTIGLNLHRIEGLAEQFVVFNDDMFLGRECRADQFFTGGGLPRDMARLCIVQPSGIGHIIYNDMELLQAEYGTREVLRGHFGKWFAGCYGLTNLLKTASLAIWQQIPGIFDPHLPQPYLRRQWVRAWEQWGERFDATCRHRLRTLTDVSDYLVRYDMLCRGEFRPIGFGDCRLLTLEDATLEDICGMIETKRYRMLCLNDSERIADFDAASERLCRAFEHILPEKSSYER